MIARTLGPWLVLASLTIGVARVDAQAGHGRKVQEQLWDGAMAGSTGAMGQALAGGAVIITPRVR